MGAGCLANEIQGATPNPLQTQQASCRLGLVVRTVGMVRARVKIGLANLVYNFTRLAWLQGRTAPA